MRLRAWIGFFVAASAVVTSPVKAEVLSLHEAIQTAQAVSPDLRGLQAQTLSVQAKARQAWAPYEPNLTLTYADSPSLLEVGNPADVQLMVQEQIGFPGRAAINHSALSSQASALEAQLKAMNLQVASNTKAAYFQLGLARQTLALNLETRESYLRIEQVAKRRYAAGAIPQVDLINAQVTLYSNDNDLSDMQSAVRAAQAQLNVLLGWPSERECEVEPFKTSYFPLPDLATAETKMLDQRHEIRSARYSLEASDKAVTLAKYSLLPDFFIMLGSTDYKQAGGSPWAGLGSNYPTYTYTASLQISIPIFGLFNEREAIRSASQDRANAQAILQTQLNASRTALASTLENLKALQTRLKNNEDHLLPLSDQAFNLALINYSAGKIDFETLSTTANSRRAIRLAHFQAIVNYLNGYANLGQLLGEDL